MELTFNNDKNCSISSAEGDPYKVSGSGQFAEEADEWGGKPRDVIYLEYTYTDAANNETHTVSDQLVIRDRAVVFEELDVELK